MHGEIYDQNVKLFHQVLLVVTFVTVALVTSMVCN